jgi:glycosyltransferase involved in cell wall biosynthesis
VGLPVYKGGDLIVRALGCLQQQMFDNFEAIISVDGNDAATAAACRPFLADPRFRMVVHPERLDWVGNFNWLLQQNLNEFFCYRQHDDTTAPEFFETLLQVADKEPSAVSVYCDCQWTGGRNDIEVAPSIEGEPLDRMLQYIERLKGTPIRGLIRTTAIRQAGLIRFDELRATQQIHNWLPKLLREGIFKRVAKPLYYRLDHARSFTREYEAGTEERRRAEYTTLFTGLLDAAIPLCRTPEERLFFQQTIFERVVAVSNYRPGNDRSSTEKLISQCLERLTYEGNTDLLRDEEIPVLFRQLHSRLDEVRLRDHSPLRKGIYEIRQRARFARLIYPRSRIGRVSYRLRHLYRFVQLFLSQQFSRGPRQYARRFALPAPPNQT